MKKIIPAFIFFVGCSWATPAMAAKRRSIEVKVEVTEVDQMKASQLGIKWPETVVLSENGAAGVVSVGAIARTTALHADIHLLIEEGAAELLANPNLITDAGTTATFHAGGELPYMTSTNLGATNVEFKRYGVMLSIRPDVVQDSFIRLKIRAALSAPDGTNGVQLSGNTVPALAEREVTSNVTVSPGMTMTLAGLVQTRKEQIVHGVPILRRIPILGALFRWKKSNFRRTTVVVFVTPRFVDL